MAYNPYYDLSPMERNRLANEEFRRVSMNNIINQAQLAEKANEPEYEGKKLYDEEELDISSELNEIDDNFRFLNSNVIKLKDYIDIIGKPGRAVKKPDPKDYGGNIAKAYKEADKKYKDYMATKDIKVIKEGSINTFADNITKNIYNLESIISNTKNVLRGIKDIGEENFNFSQFNDTFKLYSKFVKEYNNSFIRHFYPIKPLNPGEFIFKPILDYMDTHSSIPPGADRMNEAAEYVKEFNVLCLEVLNLYEGIKQLSQEKATRKLQLEGSGKNRDLNRKYHWNWM